MGVPAYSASQQAKVTGAGGDATAPFVLHLVITNANFPDLYGTIQPMIYVDTPCGSQSTATLALPSHRLIKLVISNYDPDNFPIIGQQFAGLSALTVSDTVDGTVSVLDSTNLNMSSRTAAEWKSVTSVEAVSHTFTIAQLGINIPIPAASTVVAYIYLDVAGPTPGCASATAAAAPRAGEIPCRHRAGWKAA